ncbi:hypothetical protein [Chryseobacterium pyrolae]|uniref:hypothetical protein n=1 Tax=Chryseobacterium pyrolae TaxID=2987481 RepID=UPI0021E7B29B|nr:hypothetical protein [Chryseobacterium pyrolae]
MESLYFLTDKFNLIVLIIAAICYYYVLYIYYKHIRGNESKKFLAQNKFWNSMMILISVLIYSAFVSLLILLIFGDKPINNLNLVYVFITIILIPIIHQFFLRMYIKWSNS